LTNAGTGAVLTYGELGTRSNRLAHLLRTDAAGPPSSMHCRAWPHGLAATIRLQLARTDRGGIARWKQVIGDGLRSHAEERRRTEVDVAVDFLNRMLEFGRPIFVRVA